MNSHRLQATIAMALIGVSASSCTMAQPPPRTRAAALELSCGPAPSAVDARIMAPRNVDRVEPLYAIVSSTPNGMESRLIGATVHLRTMDGVTAEDVGHALTCHAARQTLGGRPADDSSPYYVPGVWVDIQVKADPVGYDVTLRGQDFEEARQILERARSFASN